MMAPMGMPMIPPQGFPPPNKVVSSRGWYNAKIVLGAISIVVCIIILGLGGALASSFPYSDWAWVDLILGYCPVCLSSHRPGCFADQTRLFWPAYGRRPSSSRCVYDVIVASTQALMLPSTSLSGSRRP